MEKHVIWLAVLGAYPTLHAGATVFVRYMPDPGEAKSWYSAFYHTIAWWAMGNHSDKPSDKS